VTDDELSADDLEAMLERVRHLEFQYAVAQVKRASHLRQLKKLEDAPMQDRTLAHQRQLAHHKGEVRAHEQVMRDSIREAQRLESAAMTGG